MLKSVEGVYREGKVELLEPVPDGMAGRVIVTFVSSADRMPQSDPSAASSATIDLSSHMTPEQAADLRCRLAAFVEDWQRPEMDAYDAL